MVSPGNRDRRARDQPLDLLACDRAGVPVALGEADQRHKRQREREPVDEVDNGGHAGGSQRATGGRRGRATGDSAGSRTARSRQKIPDHGQGETGHSRRHEEALPAAASETPVRETRAGTAPRARRAPGSARSTRAPAGCRPSGTPPRAPAYSSTPPASTVTPNSTPVSASSTPIRFDGRCHRISEPISPIVSASSLGVTARTARRPDSRKQREAAARGRQHHDDHGDRAATCCAPGEHRLMLRPRRRAVKRG